MEDLFNKQINDLRMGRPHVVILGAGATFATCKELGDEYNSNKPPLMNNLIEILELQELLKSNDIDETVDNFEEMYSNLSESGNYIGLLNSIEKRIHDYFSEMELPNCATIYDHLILSLRPKDIVVTFNWDPLLFDAWSRNYHDAKLPKTFYLHGNVRIGYCIEHKIKGDSRGICPKCKNKLTPSKLLFPVKQKNYTKDPFISKEWEAFSYYLSRAYIVTIFGYSAPTSDVEAISIMKNSWGDIKEKQLEEIEIIDVKDRDVLRKTWDPFIHTHHYRAHNSFYDSFINKYPRRSCEAMWNMLMQCEDYPENKIPKEYDFYELMKWYKPLFEAENK